MALVSLVFVLWLEFIRLYRHVESMSALPLNSQACSASASFGLSTEHLTFVSRAIDSASAELRRLNLEVILEEFSCPSVVLTE